MGYSVRLAVQLSMRSLSGLQLALQLLVAAFRQDAIFGKKLRQDGCEALQGIFGLMQLAILEFFSGQLNVIHSEILVEVVDGWTSFDAAGRRQLFQEFTLE